MGIKCRLVEVVGKRYEASWIKDIGGHVHIHRETITEEQWKSDSKWTEFDRETVCDECKQAFHVSPSFGTRNVWNTEDGKLHPGDMWYEERYHGEHKEFYCKWDNCNDSRGHLLVMLPNGHTWDTDSRASNCTMKDDHTHRCWVKVGEAPNIHVDKNGFTCTAGAGSILSGDYHGFLHNGELVSC